MCGLFVWGFVDKVFFFVKAAEGLEEFSFLSLLLLYRLPHVCTSDVRVFVHR